jgi:hypothetical protein
MGGMNETEIPTAAKGIKGDRHTIGSLRAHTNNDQVHFHDDAGSLRFAYPGLRKFQLGMDNFLKHQQHNFAVGDVCVVRGDVVDSSRKAADLVLTRTAEAWEISLAPAGETQEAYVIADPVMAALDDFVQRI